MKNILKISFFITGILIGIFLLNVEVTAVNMALIDIAMSINMPLRSSDLIITALLISFAAIIVTAGRMGDIFGYYRVVLSGLIVFTIGAIVCAIAYNMPIILTGRILQGVGAGLCSSNMVTYAYITFPDEKRGFVSGLTMGIVGLAIACGPLFGGVFTQILNWRWIFWIDLPIGLVSIILITTFRPHFNNFKAKGRIDILGLLIAAVSMICLTLSLQAIKSAGLLKFIYSIITIFSIIVFYYVEKNIKNPLIDIKLLRNRPAIVIGCTARFVSVIIFWIMLFVLSILLEKDLGYSPIISGLLLLPMTLCVGFLSPISGVLVEKYGSKLPNIIGMTGFFISSLLLLSYSYHSSWLIFFLMLVVFGISFSVTSTSFLHFTLENSPDDNKGVTGAIYYMLSLVGGLVGLPLVSPLISGSSINMEAISFICSFSSIIGVCIFLCYYYKEKMFFLKNKCTVN